MPRQAAHGAGHAGDEIDYEKGGATIDALGERSQVPQAPHVDGQMHYADVEEHRAQQAPPLSAKSQRPKVRAPAKQLLGARMSGRDARQQHRQKDDHAYGDQRVSNQDTRL